MSNTTTHLRHMQIRQWRPWQFAPDNTAVAVMSDKQFNRFEKGHFWIKPWETVGHPIRCAFRLASYNFQLETKDKFVVDWQINIQFYFDPTHADKPVQSRLVSMADEALIRIIKFRAEPILRLLVCDLPIGELASPRTFANLPRQLGRVLNERVAALGIKVDEQNIALGHIAYPENYENQKDMRRHSEFFASSSLSRWDKSVVFGGPKFIHNTDPLTMLLWMQSNNQFRPPYSDFSAGTQPIGD